MRDLERDRPLQMGVKRPPDDAKSPLPNPLQEAESAQQVLAIVCRSTSRKLDTKRAAAFAADKLAGKPTGGCQVVLALWAGQSGKFGCGLVAGLGHGGPEGIILDGRIG